MKLLIIGGVAGGGTLPVEDHTCVRRACHLARRLVQKNGSS